jgi:hypothetical protein
MFQSLVVAIHTNRFDTKKPLPFATTVQVGIANDSHNKQPLFPDTFCVPN